MTALPLQKKSSPGDDSSSELSDELSELELEDEEDSFFDFFLPEIKHPL